MNNHYDRDGNHQSSGFRKALTIALFLAGACLLAVFTYFAGVLIALLVDFFRTPEEVGLIQMVMQAFGVEEGVVSFNSGSSSGFELELSPGVLLLFAVMFVLMGLSSLGGLVSGGLRLGAKMMMLPLEPKIKHLRGGESSAPAAKSTNSEDDG